MPICVDTNAPGGGERGQVLCFQLPVKLVWGLSGRFGSREDAKTRIGMQGVWGGEHEHEREHEHENRVEDWGCLLWWGVWC